MAQKTAVVTGGTSGLGEAASVALGQAGWRVLIVGRDPERGAAVAARAGNGSRFVAADLFSLADVRRLAAELRELAPRLDALINNAGGVFSKGEPTVDGLERTFALNVAAPLALTEALLEPLAAANGRVINVVTGLAPSMKTRLDQLVGKDASGGMFGYARNKLALLALTLEEQARFGDRGITFVALHPGIIPTTRFGHTMTGFNPFTTIGPALAKLFRIGVTEEVAASRYVKLACDPVEGAGYYYEGELRAVPKQLGDAAFVRSVWELAVSHTRSERAAA
ncbi:MAG: SDR family NAD(P)-dependent oxidoreductase [Sandaracinaceae bacterium]